jgi:hypothetical protein
LPPVAHDFESWLAAARESYQRNNPHEALGKLDRARSVAAKNRDEEQLQRVLDFAEGSLARDEQTEVERENLLYAVRQNLRQLARRRALLAGESWTDPFPDLESPRSQTRTFISRGLKFWIAVGVVIGLLFAAAFVAALIAGALSSSGDDLNLRVRNDTGGRVTVKWCSTVACNADFDPIDTMHLEPGEYARRDLPSDDIADLFVVEGSRVGRVCLPIRVDQTFEGLPDKQRVVAVRISQATPCPGEIVTPQPVV